MGDREESLVQGKGGDTGKEEHLGSIQSLMKFEETIHSVKTRRVKAMLKSQVGFFQVLGRLHGYLSRKALRKDLGLGRIS